jgi:hypothetical protein
MEKKRDTTPEELCKTLPDEFREYVHYTRNMNYEDDPNYEYLKSLFRKIMEREEYEMDFFYDWSKQNDEISMPSQPIEHEFENKKDATKDENEKKIMVVNNYVNNVNNIVINNNNRDLKEKNNKNNINNNNQHEEENVNLEENKIIETYNNVDSKKNIKSDLKASNKNLNYNYNDTNNNNNSKNNNSKSNINSNNLIRNSNDNGAEALAIISIRLPDESGKMIINRYIFKPGLDLIPVKKEELQMSFDNNTMGYVDLDDPIIPGIRR